MRRDAYFNRIWYEEVSPPWWLRLLAFVFRGVSALRRGFYRMGILRRTRLAVPVIMIGNLTVGGTGKTPLALLLVRDLLDRGFRPGIVSRGYGGKAGKSPLMVDAGTPVTLAGDEPVLLARRAGVPVCVHPRRARAGQLLLASSDIDVLVCDDGLQHYALARDVEIAVVDGSRGLGNGRCLPAGPLRESPRRLKRVDYVVINGESAVRVRSLSAGDPATMRLQPTALVNVRTGQRLTPDALADRRCAALAGIGNPQRFFSTLAELGYHAECRAFPDHHVFVAADFEFVGGRPLLMTEKDAVKCREFAPADWWYLEITAVLENSFMDDLAERLRRLQAKETGH